MKSEDLRKESGDSCRRHIGVLCMAVIAAACWSAAWGQREVGLHTSHGLALYGELKYGPDFRHFDYVNPDAPKGGTFTYAWGVSFDTLHPFIVVGTPPAFLTIETVLYDRLMIRSGDEPTAVYGLVAESITYPDDFSWVEFRLRNGARWHDGKPLTAGDVVFSLDILKSQGSPQYRNDYADVDKAEATESGGVRFTFRNGGSRALAYTVASLPILPKHYWQGRDFSRPTVEPPLGSGPYRIAKVDPGRAYTLERVPDYWAKDIPVNRGRWNVDVIQHDFYRDISVAFEAFMAGKADLRWETLPAQWATGYDVPAAEDGRLIKEMLSFQGATFYAGFYMNQRRDKFRDPKLREAIAQAFDFEWLNRTIFYGEYIRLRSHFDHTELANQGIPQGLELEYLEPFRGQLDPRVFTRPWDPPKTDATEDGLRRNLRRAAQLLNEAGWTMKDGVLMDRSGKPMEFEILLWDPFFERVAAPFAANLKRLGINARLRMVDTSEWFRRMESFDYDMTQGFTLPQSLSPGPEQREYWGSAAAGQIGSRNWMGISSPVVDALVERVIAARSRDEQVAATQALDRVLCWGFYSIPNAYVRGIPVAYWNRFGRPAMEPEWLRPFWVLGTWWIDPAKDAALESKGGKKAK
jgi:microcin C transport system substrate-binding protein